MSTRMSWRLSTPEGAADVVVPAMQLYRRIWLNNITRVMCIANRMKQAVARVNLGCGPRICRLVESTRHFAPYAVPFR